MRFDHYGFPPSIMEDRVYDSELGYVTKERIASRNLRRDVNRLALTGLGFFAASFLCSFLMVPFILQGVGISTEFYFLFAAFSTVLGIAVPFGIYMLTKRSQITSFLRFERISLLDGLLLVLGGVAVCLLGNFPATWWSQLLEGMGFSAQQPASPEASTLAAKVLLIVSTALFPAIFEEFAFRGVLLSGLRKHGDGFAILVSAFLFSIMHISAGAIPFALVAGLVLGYLYVKTNNLWVCVFVHGINNLVSCLMQIFSQDMESHVAEAIGNAMFFGLILLGIAAIVVLLVRKRLDFNFEKGLCEIGPAQKFACVVSNPGFIVYVVLCFGMTILTLFGLST